MHWIFLIVAGAFEMAWVVCLKFSQGFTKPAASVGTVVFMAASLYFLSLAAKTIPLTTAYAIWTCIAAAGVAILGIFLFAEVVTPLRIGFLLLIIVGIVGLKLTTQ
jgi:quaternary ammonium compound-resistance protein SugE